MPNARRAPHPQPQPLILVAIPNRWQRQELSAALARHSFRVTAAQNEAELLDQTHLHPPDAYVLNAEIAGLALCSTLRNFSVATPIVLIVPGTVTRTQEHDALGAGAWAVLGTPIDTAGLLLRLDAFIQPKRELERVSEECLVDKGSGLYNPAGLARRALELAALATRQGLALACAVFRPLADLPNALAGDRLALAFRSVGRISDALGRTGPSEFAVFAPATNTGAAARLVRRMTDHVERAFGSLREGHKQIGVRAGYSTAGASQRIAPDALLAQARTALETAG